MATKAKLTYTCGRGRAENIRFVLAAAGVEFDEDFLTEKEQFQKLQDDGYLLFMQVPLLEIDGLNLVQSGAIIRYVARKYNLMGKTLEEEAMVNTLHEGSRDFLGAGFFSLAFLASSPEKVQETMKKIQDKAATRFIPIFEKVYTQSTSGFLVGDSLTLADVSWLEVLLWLHELMPEFAISHPSIAVFTSKISSLPQMSAFLSGPQRKPPPDAAYAAGARKIFDL